jgi:undecaprenyl diphosphate synthase
MKQKTLQHVALIMDGNRRWAKEQGVPSFAGHTEGYKRIEGIINYAKEYGIKYVTFWAFSTENWKRDEKEVSFLLNLYRKVFKSRLVAKLLKNGGKINIIGDLTRFPEDIQELSKQLIVKSQNNTAMTITFALNYGGRADIVQAVQKIITDNVKSADLTEELFSQYLQTKDMPDPDLIIRTGGESRLSGYLPWQSVYSELLFVDTFWPAFDDKAFAKALQDYENRERRFGK